MPMSVVGLSHCLDKLPAASLKKGKFCEYTNLNMKRTPDWSAMSPYIGTLNALFVASKGKNLLHSSMQKGIGEWNIANDMQISEQEQEKGGYSLRVMISQLSNHKRRGRQVPRVWRQKFQCLHDMILFDGSDGEVDQEDQGPSGDESVPAVHSCGGAVGPCDDDVEFVDEEHPMNDIESVQSSEPIDDHDLFHSKDPDLDALLQNSVREVRRRIAKKMAVPSILPPPAFGHFSMGDIEHLTSDDVPLNPNAFKLLNKAIKAATNAKSDKGKEKPSKKPSKKKNDNKSEQKENENGKKSSLHKLEHSKAYHKELLHSTKVLGLSHSEAKERARAAAQTRIAELFGA
jgi:hypothetical protein